MRRWVAIRIYRFSELERDALMRLMRLVAGYRLAHEIWDQEMKRTEAELEAVREALERRRHG